jgi:drug/metabolite transporter (DMT)-like permease
MTLAPVGMLERGNAALARETAPEGAFAWSVWPAKERPSRAWLVVSALAAIGACTAVAMGDLWIGVMAALAIAVSLQRFLLPTDCMLTEDGIKNH